MSLLADGEAGQLADEPASHGHCLADRLQRCAHLCIVTILGVKVCQFSMGQYAVQHVVEIVGDATGHLANDLQLL
jgi:hypothetical protein